MNLHRGRLFLDSKERVVELPTDFIRDKRKSLAPLSAPRYAQRLLKFCVFLESHPTFGAVPVDAAIRAMPLGLVEEYYLECHATKLAPHTLRSHEVALKAFCKWLASKDSGPAIPVNIYGGVKYLTAHPPPLPPRYVTVADVIRLLEQLHWEDQRVLAHFIYDTGLRIAEVPRVLRSDIPDPSDYPADSMYFPLFVRGGKGSRGAIKPRYTIISRPMISRLHKYHNSKHYFAHSSALRGDAPAFLNTEGNPITVDAIESFIYDGYARGNLKVVSAHRLRHGTAYSVLKSEHGKSLLDNLIVAKEVLGHAKLKTTEIYTRVPAPALRRNCLNTASGDTLFRFEEAQQIMDATYLPSHKHKKRKQLSAARG